MRVIYVTRLFQMLTKLFITVTIVLGSAVSAENGQNNAPSIKHQSDWQAIESIVSMKNGEEVLNKEKKPHREPILFGEKRMSENNIVNKRVNNSKQNSASFDHEFWVYDADVFLYDDYDGDGYYRRFSIDFDVDVSDGYADIYADIYIRAPGDDWRLLHTTDVFEIYEEDASDGIEVMTTLLDGYFPDHYDILIDVWEYTDAGDYLVVTYDHIDDYDLDGLPLEDRDEDDNYYDEHDYVEVSAGSSGSVLLLLCLAFMIARYMQRQKRTGKLL